MFALSSPACARGGGAAIWRARLSVEAATVEWVSHPCSPEGGEVCHRRGLGVGWGWALQEPGRREEDPGTPQRAGGRNPWWRPSLQEGLWRISDSVECVMLTPLLVSPSASSEKAEERGSLGGGSLRGGVWAVLLPSCVVLRKLLSVSELQLSPRL